jgi:hypothetical protein
MPLQQSQVSGMAPTAGTPYNTFRDDSPTKLKSGYDHPNSSDVFRPQNELNSPEKLISPTKTDRMNTTGGLMRKNTLLNSTALHDEYKIANYALAE